MSQISFCVVAAVMLAVTGVYEVKGESSPQTGLLLKVHSSNLRGTTTNEFAVNEPVWLSVGLVNTSAAAITVWVDGDESRGVTCRPVHGHDAKARVLRKDVPLERNFKQVVVAPGEEIPAEVLMNDFLQVHDQGAFSIDCEMGVKDGTGTPFLVKTIVPLQFINGLATQEISTLVDQLQQQFNSGDETMRVRVVKSCSSLPPSAVMGVLAKAISDNSERVELAALKVLCAMTVPREEVMPLLQKAAQSEKESVRRRAAMDMEKHEMR
ncbi:MAG: HEAT repeat domain-containing protein [Candidatus Eisenbacteria bacterium]|nr:HEAT repeat domain-containing protein [Candidatus Eisenbacteria bacterium]